MKESPDTQLIQILKSLSAAEAQNRLMRITDRNLAICMLYMDDPDRNIVLDRLGKMKRERIKQELAYVQHLRLRYPQYKSVIEKVIVSIVAGKDVAPQSYIRPLRNDRL